MAPAVSASEYSWTNIEGVQCIKTCFVNGEKLSKKEKERRRNFKNELGAAFPDTIMLDSNSVGEICNAIVCVSSIASWIQAFCDLYESYGYTKETKSLPGGKQYVWCKQDDETHIIINSYSTTKKLMIQPGAESGENAIRQWLKDYLCIKDILLPQVTSPSHNSSTKSAEECASINDHIPAEHMVVDLPARKECCTVSTSSPAQTETVKKTDDSTNAECAAACTEPQVVAKAMASNSHLCEEIGEGDSIPNSDDSSIKNKPESQQDATIKEVPVPSLVVNMDQEKSTGKSDDQDDDSQASSQRAYMMNELLCFVQNKMDIMPKDPLVNICVQFYDENAIMEAKQLLFSKVPARMKLVNRRGTYKAKSNMEDIIQVLLEAQIAETPLFTAQSLGNLPALSVSCVDSLHLRTVIDTLQQQVHIINANQKDMLDLIKTKVVREDKQNSESGQAYQTQDLSVNEAPMESSYDAYDDE